MDNYWWNLLTESVFGAIFDGLLLASIALYVWYRQQKALRQGKLEDAVLVSFNQVVKHEEKPLLTFRTPLSGSMREIFLSEGLIKEIKRAAAQVSEDHPVIQLNNEKFHNMMQRGMINFCNQLNIHGQVAALSGQPFVEKEYFLALTYEPGAVTKMFRILLVDQKLFDQLDQAGEDLTFGLPYHRDRLIALKAIRQALDEDRKRQAQSRVLAPFMVASPSLQALSTETSEAGVE